MSAIPEDDNGNILHLLGLLQIGKIFPVIKSLIFAKPQETT